MAEAESVGPGSGGTAGVGFGINYVGIHAYAYSGTLGVDDNETTMLLFSTGSSYIVAKIQFFELTISNDDIEHAVKINGEKVITVLSSNSATVTEPDIWIPVLLPPFSVIEVIGNNAQSSSTLSTAAIIVGRVYDA